MRSKIFISILASSTLSIGSLILSAPIAKTHSQIPVNKASAIRLRWFDEPSCNNPPACDLTAIVAGVGTANYERELLSIRIGDSDKLITRAQWRPLIDRYSRGRNYLLQERKWYCGFLTQNNRYPDYYDLELVGLKHLSRAIVVDDPKDCFCMERTRYNRYNILLPPRKIPNKLVIPKN